MAPAPLYAAVWLPRFHLQAATRGLGLSLMAEVVVLDGSFATALGQQSARGASFR